MPMSSAVAVDLEGGVITLGATQITLSSDGDHFRLPNGVRVRAITFGERSAAIARALAECNSEDNLLAGLRSLGLDGSADPQSDAALLALAGGGEHAPSFMECARRACKKTALDWKAVEDIPAVAVDRVAAPNQTTQNDDGWIRIAFEPETDDPQDLAGISREMIERLLARGVERNLEEALTPPQRTTTKPEASDRAPKQVLRARIRKGAASDTDAAVPRPLTKDSAAAEPIYFQELPTPSKRPYRAWSPALSPIDPSSRASDSQASPSKASEPQPMRAAARMQPSRSPEAPHSAPAPMTWPSPGAPGSLRTGSAATTLAPITPATKSLAPTHPSHVIETAEWSRPQAALGPLTSWPDPISEPTQHSSPSPLPNASPAIDWLSEIAQALAAECDLRGIDA
jgi:hypothetical protein